MSDTCQVTNIACAERENITSIINEINQLNQGFNEIKTDVRAIKTCLMGDLSGSERGLKQRLIEIEEWAANVKRILWLIIGAMIPLFVGGIAAILKIILTHST